MRNWLMGLLAGALGAGATALADPLPDSIDLGVLFPLTGNAGYIGEEGRTGLDLFLAQYDQRRAAEGLPKINPIVIDSQADARVGFQGFQLLSSRYHPQVVFLTYTNVAKAAAPQANRDHTAMLNLTQGAVTLLGPNFTSILPAYTLQGEIIFKTVQDFGVKNIAVIYENSEAFVVFNKDIQTRLCPQHGCNVVASEQLPQGATQVAAQVTAALAAKPDGVVLIGIAPQLIPIGRELQTQGFAGHIFGFTDMREVVAQGQGKLLEGAIFPTVKVDQASAPVHAFYAAYQEHFGKPPTENALFFYEGMQVIEGSLKALKASGKPYSGDNFVEAQKSGVISTLLGDVRFLSDGRVAEPMLLQQIKDGKSQTLREISAADLHG